VFHPTQKPVELGRYLIRTFSKAGDLVLDNAFGSGSFLVAAASEGRDYVGIELNQGAVTFKNVKTDWIDVAVKRLKAVNAKANVFRSGEIDEHTRIQ
jgi:site-specific DNA-methyltransferase (adenine-specific)/modification methylase